MHFDRRTYITTTTHKKKQVLYVDIKHKQRKNCYKSYLNSARAKKKKQKKNDDPKNLFSHILTHTYSSVTVLPRVHNTDKYKNRAFNNNI